MKTVSAYRAEDGSLHETREGAAVADLVAAGFDPAIASQIIERRAVVEDVLRQLTGRAHIPAYYPPLEDAA
ncbi:hypothetical protein ACFOHK_08370 [Falsigemmobacter intermedius]|uniref:Uncharacterized protein n=1 Tax=Falsigemmobacter intermedius TaxID=1553448 RepID=A0A3S3TYY1_9RHOB|nr:hypothetical protein [Falsigemmobacter intermedius]RWY36384.1 hypothetical protein EP867_18085 [Falsigemmobacter intermedius]